MVQKAIVSKLVGAREPAEVVGWMIVIPKDCDLASVAILEEVCMCESGVAEKNDCIHDVPFLELCSLLTYGEANQINNLRMKNKNLTITYYVHI